MAKNTDDFEFFEEKEYDKREALGITSKKAEDFSDWYQQVIIKSGLVDYTKVSGCVVFRPYSYEMWEKVHDYMDPRFKALGVKNAYFPMLIPESLLTKESQHVEGFTPEVAWVTHAGDTELSEKLAVRPTSETIMYDSYSRWVRSHKDLPLRLNQWNSVVRWEFKHAVPFLRTREFLWQEGHTAFATKEEADREVSDALTIYQDCFREVFAIPSIAGRKSEKEKFAGALYTTSAEIFLPNGKAIQGATSHCLGQNFAKAFDISFTDEKGEKQYVWQNSWGYTTRSIGIMIMMHGDDKGLVLPPNAAPIQVVIVPIIFDKTKAAVLEAVDKIKEQLSEFRIHVDDRDDYTAGRKFNEWELKGVPVRIEIGPKDVEKQQVVVARRDSGEKTAVSMADVKSAVKVMIKDIQDSLYNKAEAHLRSSLRKVETWEELLKGVEDKALMLANHCGDGKCEEEIKGKTNGVKSLNIPFGMQDDLKGKCINCDRPAKYRALFAKSY